MLSWIGWIATSVFASSYLCRSPLALRRVQAAAAVLWVIYGTLIHALPVVVANLIVAAFAGWSSFAKAPRSQPERSEEHVAVGLPPSLRSG